ncbi:hypothetical protein C4G84_RS19070 [Vibrio parahaemolyticus O5:K30]|uniref:hypothetical protein n=1 Tax=Vibrio vulnificus TaxID=672 RepID=UPI003D9CA395|nr:hypothetical protein [Vibrio parahaemolyticus O5:K30]
MLEDSFSVEVHNNRLIIQNLNYHDIHDVSFNLLSDYVIHPCMGNSNIPLISSYGIKDVPFSVHDEAVPDDGIIRLSMNYIVNGEARMKVLKICLF